MASCHPPTVPTDLPPACGRTVTLNLPTIFDDFVTTKKRGLGLGLAMAKRVVEQLGGTIAVTSEVGLGTTFTIRFPLTKSRPEQLAVG